MHPLRGKIETERCGRERKGKKKKKKRKRGFRVKFFRLTEHSSFEKGSFRNVTIPRGGRKKWRNAAACLIKWESVLLPAKVRG